MDFGPSIKASGCVGLELVTQDLLLTVELAHVIHTTLKEWCWIHHIDTVPGKQNDSSGRQLTPRLTPVIDLTHY